MVRPLSGHGPCEPVNMHNFARRAAFWFFAFQLNVAWPPEDREMSGFMEFNTWRETEGVAWSVDRLRSTDVRGMK